MNSTRLSVTARRFLLTTALAAVMAAQARAEPPPDACCTADPPAPTIISPGLGTLSAVVQWLRLMLR